LPIHLSPNEKKPASLRAFLYFCLASAAIKRAAVGQSGMCLLKGQQLPFLACPGGQKPPSPDRWGSTTTEPEGVYTAHPPSSAITANRDRSFFVFMLYTLNNVVDGRGGGRDAKTADESQLFSKQRAPEHA
jgi:hypothetical protein